jgi:hypothetical protein
LSSWIFFAMQQDKYFDCVSVTRENYYPSFELTRYHELIPWRSGFARLSNGGCWQAFGGIRSFSISADYRSC